MISIVNIYMCSNNMFWKDRKVLYEDTEEGKIETVKEFV
jgi:hypothetical protein